MKTIYIIHGINTKYYMIGRTEDVSNFLKEIQPLCPFKLKIYKEYLCQDSQYIEKQLKTKFSDFNVNSNWYTLNKTQLSSIDKCICDIILEINKKLETNTCKLCNYFTYDDDQFTKHIKSSLHKYKEKHLNNSRIIKVILNDDFTDEKAVWLENRNLKIKFKELEEKYKRLTEISILNSKIENKQQEIKTKNDLNST